MGKKIGGKGAFVSSFVFALLFCTLAGHLLVKNGSGKESGLLGWLLVLGTSACLLPAASCAAHWFCGLFQKLGSRPAVCASIPSEKATPKRAFIFYFCFLLLCWLPVFLAYFPGLFAYDVSMQLDGFSIGVYWAYHPLAHTLLLRFFYMIGERLGSYSAGMALYTLFQAVVVSLCIAYALLSLYKRQTPFICRLVILLFYALFPAVSVLAISISKDAIFSALFLLFSVLAYEALETPELLSEERFSTGLVASGVLACIFRHNAVYAVAVYFLVLVILLKPFKHWRSPSKHLWAARKHKRRLLALMLYIALLSVCVNEFLMIATNASEGPKTEMLSVPIQQIGRVYSLHKDELEPQIIEEINLTLPAVENYIPELADPLKGSTIINNKYEFFELWAKLLVRYPLTYVDAFLHNSMGFWFIDDVSHAKIYGEGLESRQGYLLTDTKPGFGVEHISYFPFLENIYEKAFSANEYQSIPVLSILFSPALYFWILLAIMLASLYLKRKNVMYVSLFAFAYYATMLLGPCALIRYMFPIVLTAPILIGYWFVERPEGIVKN